jgi:hypothetical protein
MYRKTTLVVTSQRKGPSVNYGNTSRKPSNVAKETADSIRLEQVHRSQDQPIPGKTRTIVAKFTFFKKRKLIGRQWKNLNDTPYKMYKQFPQEEIEKRRRLVPRMKADREKRKRSRIAYDTL